MAGKKKATGTKRTRGETPVRQTVVDDFVIIPNNNDLLLLTIIIGDIDQTGSSRIELLDDSEFGVEHINGSFYNLAIDKCKKLDGKSLLITTSVSDTNNNTDNNRTEVTLKLFAGEKVLYVKKLQSDVRSEGDTENYVFNIRLYVF
jgi:hypothetical protein